MKQLGEKTFVIEGPTNIGCIVEQGKATLIDSGNDKDGARRINNSVKANGWEVVRVVNTHSNADHMGGNDYFARNCNVEIVASPVEDAFIRYPQLESVMLWGGYAPAALRKKQFRAKSSPVHRIVSDGDHVEPGLEVIDLPGHFFGMIGLRTPDNAVFLADAVFGSEILSKYPIPFMYDVQAFLGTLEKIRTMDAEYFIPSHGAICRDIVPLVDSHIDLIRGVEQDIVELCAGGIIGDELIAEMCAMRNIELTLSAYALYGSTIRSFLSYLCDLGRLAPESSRSGLVWRSNV